jgi:hypothetical protein
MIISLTFATESEMPLVSFGRLLLDIQHASVMIVALSRAQGLSRNDIVFRKRAWKYSNVIGMKENVFGDATAFLYRIHKDSPLQLQYLLKIPGHLFGPVRRAFQLVFERLLFGDIERTKRELDLDLQREEIIKKRIENLESAFNLAEKIPDLTLRKSFLHNLEASIRPFHQEHPEIIAFEIREDDDINPTP